MKRNVLSYARRMATIMLALSAPVVLTSCGDDDDEPTAPSNPAVIQQTVTTVHTSYDFSLGEAWYQYFDIKVTYTSAGGDKSETLTMDEMNNFSVPYESAPAKYICKVVATPKTTYPQIVDTDTYDLSVDIVAEVTGLNAAGAQVDNFGYLGSNHTIEHTASANTLRRRLQQNHTLLNFDYTLEPALVTAM